MTAPRLDKGKVVAGTYTVQALLGYGGAIATYQATAANGQAVALKLFSPLLASRQDLLGILQQAIAFTNALPADAVAAVQASGIDPGTNAPFTATELVTFPSLARAVQGGPLSLPDVVRMLRGLARALDAAHAQRLVHGALKPTNVFVGPSAVKVADFGVRVARIAAPTPEGFALAAPWMAPEQLQQGAADGPAVDVFAAALLAFYAATGRSFWRSCQGPVPDGAAWQQEIAAPRAGASVRAREIGAVLPPALDQIMSRALALDPAQRHGSVGELAEALASRATGGAKLGMTMPLNQQSPFAQQAAAPPARPAEQPRNLGSTVAIASPADDLSHLPNFGGEGEQNEPATLVTGSPLDDFQGPRGAQPQAYPQPQAQPQYAPQQQAAYAQPRYEEPVAVPKKKTGLFLALGAVAFLVIAGIAVVVGLFFARRPAATAVTAPSATTSPTSTAAAPATIAPPATTTAEAPSASAAPAEAADAAAAAPEDAGEETPGEVTVTCKPECESLSVDGNDLQDLVDPVQLPAGAHTIVAGKQGYLSQTKKITLKAGEKQTVSFLLFKPGPAPAPQPPKPCGKFLERCP